MSMFNDEAVEALFAAEQDLRRAAVKYSGLICDDTRRALRKAAIVYTEHVATIEGMCEAVTRASDDAKDSQP